MSQYIKTTKDGIQTQTDSLTGTDVNEINLSSTTLSVSSIVAPEVADYTTTLTANAVALADNAASIAANSSAISDNTASIANNSASVANNAATLAANSASIQDNTDFSV